LDLDRIISELESERDRIIRAIALLESESRNGKWRSYTRRSKALVGSDEEAVGGEKRIDPPFCKDRCAGQNCHSREETWWSHRGRQKTAVASDEAALGGAQEEGLSERRALVGSVVRQRFSRWPAARRVPSSRATIPGRARTLLDLDFLAQSDLNNCSERFAFGAHFRH
jgi:hypothetical protein